MSETLVANVDHNGNLNIKDDTGAISMTVVPGSIFSLKIDDDRQLWGVKWQPTVITSQNTAWEADRQKWEARNRDTINRIDLDRALQLACADLIGEVDGCDVTPKDMFSQFLTTAREERESKETI